MPLWSSFRGSFIAFRTILFLTWNPYTAIQVRIAAMVFASATLPPPTRDPMETPIEDTIALLENKEKQLCSLIEAFKVRSVSTF